jgi:hypothetical protein
MSSDANELHAFAADLRKTSGRAQKMARMAVAKTAADITADAKVMAPFRTGNLRNSIGYDVQEDGTGVQAEIGPTASYGPFWSGALRAWRRGRSSVQPMSVVSLLSNRLCSV